MKVRYVAGLGLLALGLAVLPAQAQTGPAGVVRYYHADAVGTIRAVTDANGAVVTRHDYFPFGEEPANAPNPAAHRFTGHERDTESGMDYFGARYYMQRLGRFTTSDPDHVGGDVFDPQSWNAYAYARNNPLRFIDPTGTDYFVNVDEGQSFWASNADFERLRGNPGAGISLFGGLVLAGGRIVGTYEYYAPFDRVVIDAGRRSQAHLEVYLKEMAVNAVTTGLFASARMATYAIPKAMNGKLSNIVDDLYRGVKGPSVPFGRGTTADAVRHELTTGLLTFGKSHTPKAREYANALTNWLRANPNASRGDRALAEGLLRDLQNSLAGR